MTTVPWGQQRLGPNGSDGGETADKITPGTNTGKQSQKPFSTLSLPLHVILLLDALSATTESGHFPSVGGSEMHVIFVLSPYLLIYKTSFALRRCLFSLLTRCHQYNFVVLVSFLSFLFCSFLLFFLFCSSLRQKLFTLLWEVFSFWRACFPPFSHPPSGNPDSTW